MIRSIAAIAAVILVTALIVSCRQQPAGTATVTVGGQHRFTCEVMDNPQSRAKGLSGRDSLHPLSGMLFVFDRPDRHGIWMKDMSFPIDIIWIREGRIVHLQHMALPEDVPSDAYLTVYRPDEPADMVLELRGGMAEAFKFAVGQTVEVDIDSGR